MRSDSLLYLLYDLGFKDWSMRKTYTADGDLNVMVCCPFHNERKPSCGISAEKEQGQCFSCGVTFNLAKFTAACLDISYKRAKEYLEERFNISFKKLNETSSLRYKDRIKKEQIFLGKYALAPYHSGKIYHDYLKERGLTKKTCEKFLIGWNSKTYRFMIPIFYLNNELMGFLARTALDRKDKAYKQIYGNYDTYLVENFKRSETLFPVNFFPKKEKTAIIVEGSFDAMLLHQFGFENTLALLTSKISKKQIDLLDLMGVKNIVLFLDNDEAGMKGTEIIFKKIKGLFNVFCVDYTGAKKGIDPASLSKEEIKTFLDNLNYTPFREKLKKLS